MLIVIIADKKNLLKRLIFHLMNIKGAYKENYDSYSSKIDLWVTSFDIQYRIFDLLYTVAYSK